MEWLYRIIPNIDIKRTYNEKSLTKERFPHARSKKATQFVYRYRFLMLESDSSARAIGDRVLLKYNLDNSVYEKSGVGRKPIIMWWLVTIQK